jgi:hypothetical protein
VLPELQNGGLLQFQPRQSGLALETPLPQSGPVGGHCERPRGPQYCITQYGAYGVPVVAAETPRR